MTLTTTFITDLLGQAAQAAGGNEKLFTGEITSHFADTLCGFPKVGKSCCESFKYEPSMIPVFADEVEGVNEYYIELDQLTKLAESKRCKLHEAFYIMQNYIAEEVSEEAADHTCLVVAGLNEAKLLVNECKLAEGSDLAEIKLNALDVTTRILEDLSERGIEIRIKD